MALSLGREGTGGLERPVLVPPAVSRPPTQPRQPEQNPSEPGVHASFSLTGYASNDSSPQQCKSPSALNVVFAKHAEHERRQAALMVYFLLRSFGT